MASIADLSAGIRRNEELQNQEKADQNKVDAKNAGENVKDVFWN